MDVYYIGEKPAFINLKEIRYAKVYKRTYKEVHYELVIEFKNVKDDSFVISYQSESDAIKRLKSIYDAITKL